MPQATKAKKRGAPENLQPVRTKEEAKERGRNGGIKSGEVRRERKALKDIAEIILKTQVDTKRKNTMKNMGLSDEDGEIDFNYATAITAALIRRAASGDVFAIKEVKELVGETDSAVVGGVTIVDDM